jgi:hypothetical protein
MPYIDPARRPELNDHMKRLEQVVKNPGDLNYVITRLLVGILKERRFRNGRWGYTDINELVGAMECAKLELYRRAAAPYENLKMSENGDVYDDLFPNEFMEKP